MSENKTIVNSWNEWDPLKHVIVGRADGTCIPAPEPALDAKVPEDSDMRGQFGPRTKDTVDKANELLDNFSNMLQKRGIKVDRPTPIDFNQKTSTPDWEAETMFGCMPPRDVLLTVGNEILEATMSYRCRWFEYLCYRPLLKDYYNIPSKVVYNINTQTIYIYNSLLLPKFHFQLSTIHLLEAYNQT